MEAWKDKGFFKEYVKKNLELRKTQLETDLQNLSWVSNRSLEQTKFLFRLCEEDFDKLFSLEAKLKRFQLYFYTPTTKEEVEKVLQASNADEAKIAMGYVKNKVGLWYKENEMQ